MKFTSRIKTAFNALVGTDDDKISMLFSSTNKGASIGYLSAYEKSLYVNKAIEKRATKIGEIQFIAKKGKKELENAPILNLLAKPNPIFTQTEFFQLASKYKDIFGEVYIWKVKERALFEGIKVNQLDLLFPPSVKKIYNELGGISHYMFNNGGKEIRLEKEDILYIRRPNPKDPREGSSLLRAGLLTISNSLEIDALQNSILKNGGKLDTVISFKDRERLSKLQTEDLRDKYTEKYLEAKRSGAPMFLGGDVKVDSLSVTPAELGYLEGKKVTLDDIAILTEVPKPLLATAEASTFNNADAVIRAFLKETIYPEQKSWADAFNNDLDLVPADIELEVVDQTPANQDELLKKIDSGLTKGWLTINEAREMENLDPVDNGDEILVGFSSIPLSQAVAEPEPTPEPAQDPNADAQNEPENNDEAKKGINSHPLQNKEFRAKYHKNFIKRADKNELLFKRGLNSYLISQRERLLDKVNRYIRAYKKANVDELFDLDLEISIGMKRLMPVMLEIAKEAGQNAINTVGGKRDFNLNANLHSWLENKSKVFLKQVNETTFKQLQDQFSESITAGETYSELAKRVKNTYGDITKGRSYTIARTETNGIMGKSTLDGYEQVGMRIKIWVAVMDANTRDSHAMLDGEEKEINQPFSNGLMFPSDPSGDAEETINCRCSI